MSPAMRQLVNILGGRCENLRSAYWPEVLELAGRHRVLRWVSSQLRGAHSGATLAIQSQLLEAERAAKIDGFFLSAELAGLLSAFAGASVPVLALKGPCFAERIYGDVSLRSSRDLDLLVPRSHFAAAQALLQAEGFCASSCVDDYHQPWRRHTTGVELHFDVENPLAFNFNIGAALGHASLTSFHGSPVFKLAPADELLYLCLHAVRHRFDCLSLVLDICLAFESPSMEPELDHVCALAGRNRDLWSLLQIGCRLATRLRSSSPAGKFVQASPHLDGIASDRWNELIEGKLQPALDWRAQHHFYCSLEPRFMQKGLRRLRYMRILATRTIQPDYDFASRFGIEKPWLVRAMRPIRLLSVFNRQRTRKPLPRVSEGSTRNVCLPVKEAVPPTSDTTAGMP